MGDLEVRRLGFGVADLTVDDRATAHAVLKRAVELGAHLIVTANDPLIDALITEALSPYPGDLVFAAQLRGDVRACVERDLKTLRVTQLQVAIVEIGALDVAIDLQRTGAIRHIGLAGIDREQLDAASAKAKIAIVKSILDDDLLAACEQRGIPFMPEAAASRHTIAALLARSPMVLPIASGGKVAQIEEQLGAVHDAA